MNPGQDRQGRFHRACLGIHHFRPARFVVGLDDRRILSQGPLEPYVTVDVAVGQVMNDLANGPVAIWRIQLFVGQALHGVSRGLRQHFQLLDQGFPGRLVVVTGLNKFACRKFGWGVQNDHQVVGNVIE